MKKAFLATVMIGGVLSFGGASAELFTADKVVFEDITGAVEIVTNSGDAVEVTIEQGKTYHKIDAILDADGIVRITGEKWREEETRDCCNTRIRRTFDARKDRELSTGEPVDESFFADYPTIKVTMPRNGDASFIDARMTIKMDDLAGALDLDACYAFGEIGNVEEAVIGVIAGSRLVVGNIAAALEVDVSGDADVLTGDAAMADIDIAGPGDVITGAIDGMLDVSIAGSGLVRTSRLDGPLTTRIAGSGAVSVKGGKADTLKATIDGSGGVYFEGAVGRADLRLFGSSEVQMGSLQRPLKHAGGGSVYMDGKLVEKD